MISFDEFKKVELKVVKVISAERVEGSEKLLKLQVDLGAEQSPALGCQHCEIKNIPENSLLREPWAGQRQIIAGIGKAYEPENLINKEIVIVVNLEPRKLMGMESQGMVLCASDENGPVLLCPEKEVLPGADIG